MRYITRHPDATPKLERTDKKDGRLVERLVQELTNGYSARNPLENIWIEGRRQYAGIPETAVRNQPIPNAPNVELPIGALISDSLYAQVTDTLYQASPILTAREMDEEWADHARAIQRFVNWMAANEIGLRQATDNAFQDDIQLGTGILYCPYVKEEKWTTVHKIVAEEPRVIAISPEDFLVPGGSRGDHQQDEWMNVRFWYTPGEFKSQARAQGWETRYSKPVAQQDRVRAYHEQVNAQPSNAPTREVYAVENLWMYHDYDDDGIDRDLMVAFDFNSKALLDVKYNRYDTRPVETMRYQIRPHLFWGLGTMEMVQPLQHAGTDTLNHFLLNMMLVNGRMFAARSGTISDFTKVWPMKVQPVDSIDDIKELRLSDVYPSILAGLTQLIQLAERRVGVTGDFTSGNPASRVLGTRTPGITAMSALQSVSRRVAPAFDGMRFGAAAAVRQCLWRYAEQIRADNKRVQKHFKRLLGERDALLVIDLLRQPDFERCVSVEFTAVSASVNREADRTNATLIMQAQQQYLQQIMGSLIQLAQPGTPSMMFDAAKKVLKVTNFAMDDYLRTFEQVRNPQRWLVDISTELEAAQEQSEAAGGIEQMLTGLLGGGAGGEGEGGAMPPGGGLPPEGAV